MRRALEEAFDLNTYANEGNPRLKGRGASFCMERSGYQEAGLNDQVSNCSQRLNLAIQLTHGVTPGTHLLFAQYDLGSATLLYTYDDC